MIGQGEMVNPSADDIDTMVDNHRIVQPEQGQEMRDHTPWPQPPAPTPGPHSPAPAPRPQPLTPAPRPHTPERRPRPQTPETQLLSGVEHCGLVTPQKPRPEVPTLREAEAAGNSSDVYLDQQLLVESASGDSLPDVALPDAPLNEAHLDG